MHITYCMTVRIVSFSHLQNSLALGIVHHSASAITQYARIARKHCIYPVCLDSLSKIHTMPSVPVTDCFHKIRQQVREGWRMGVVLHVFLCLSYKHL